MIKELQIQNLAVIENETVSFGPGLNVITGETGSGKSMVLQALEIILGGKAKSTSIRSGANELDVSAVFETTHCAELPDSIEIGEELLVSRSINSTGRGKVFVNGRLSTVSMLTEYLGKLVTICSQSEHIKLLDPKYHLEFLDQFGTNSELLRHYHEAWSKFKALEREFNSATLSQSKDEERIQELDDMIAELTQITLEPGLREKLESEVRKLTAGEKLKELSYGFLESLSERVGDLKSLEHLFHDLLKFDEGLKPQGELLTSASESLKDLQRELTRYSESLDLDETTLEVKRDLLAGLAKLERKYRSNDIGLISLLESALSEKERLKLPVDLGMIKKELEIAYDETCTLAKQISKARILSAKKLSKAVAHELLELNMKDVELEVRFEKTELTSQGEEKAEILISTNKGEPIKPLKNVASGGELSRIMLVLKKLLKEKAGVSVLVFDEVDTGVSGGVARAIGQKLRALAQDSQVICITHLPQVASLADKHILVSKENKGGRVMTFLRSLGDSERVEEIARMLSGKSVTEKARESARELLSNIDE